MKEVIGDECFKVLDQDIYILFYFGASWCKPCQKILPFMEELVKEYDEKIIQFYRLILILKKMNYCVINVKLKSSLLFYYSKGEILSIEQKGTI